MQKLLIPLLGACFAMPALAAGTISSGGFDVGIGTSGELYDPISGTGIRRNSDGYDPLAPGTPRESWGVRASSGAAWADQAFFGTSGVGPTVFGPFGGSATTASSSLTNGMELHMSYSMVAPNIVRIDHTLKNVSNGRISRIRFQRMWDNDIRPTEFFENSKDFGVQPVGFLDSTYYGFENPDPGVPFGLSCAAGCNFAGDLGGGVRIWLGALDPGASRSFTYWYGISMEGQSLDALIAQAASLGVTYMIGTQSMDVGLWPLLGQNSEFVGTDGGVPEPATWAMLIVGFGLVGLTARQRRRSIARA